MSILAKVVVLAMCAPAVAAYTGGRTVRAPLSPRSAAKASVFESAMANFEQDYPEFAKRGFGPTTKAERWNGRHAMHVPAVTPPPPSSVQPFSHLPRAVQVRLGCHRGHGLRPGALCALPPAVLLAAWALTTGRAPSPTLRSAHPRF